MPEELWILLSQVFEDLAYDVCQRYPHTSVETKHAPKDPLLIAVVISLPAILWGSVLTMFRMIGCWHPERMWRALS